MTFKEILNKNDFLIATSDAKLEKVQEKYNIKVRDHCHFTGKFLGAAHNNCNLNRNYYKFKIPVFFHNGKGYDAHFIIQELSNIEQIEPIKYNSKE